MASAAPAQVRRGVRECIPSGMGLTAGWVMSWLLVSKVQVGNRVSAEGLTSAMSPLQCCNVDLGHLHHRLHDALRLHGILVLQQLDHDARNDLPGQTELVLEPAALPRRAALGELRDRKS